ncbi:hypothetical protein SERLA73DRAFT_184461 [Serpula lacrymans var. lacrymans S7.3]|uniref:Uncharacterized protein n=2 Tax=Serpula lacrymans var. lacrymans TaxID=341189 RepID=F8Q3A3_SERL3|nr:uncharacterized protein SERLADRAFT_472154 [Serpula lacrymans var. lacrymans S7.9]EGN97664.1 hypothetical protein SERLA73DRAFT_184461 [Serpula lacrymans var. lacrymans S7.3]EGO23258.1 hypothetical protein SERLADRAFT_472154 [Serpula lacrymans var. lacrymans S7.9]
MSDMTSPSNPVPACSDRAKARKARIKQLELEQQKWDQEALVMTEDQKQTLLLSFKSVKTEFSDLDGLSWSRYTKSGHDNWVADDPTPKPSCTEFDQFQIRPVHIQPKSMPPYAVLSHAELASFAPEETIRVSRLGSQSPRSPLLQCSSANHLFRIPHSPVIPPMVTERCSNASLNSPCPRQSKFDTVRQIPNSRLSSLVEIYQPTLPEQISMEHTPQMPERTALDVP